MVDPKLITSYAQLKEDLILYSILGNVKDGFYIDIGANYPTVDSVTKLFYDKGWTGINIEPIPELFNQIINERPKDINLNCAIGLKKGTQKFFQNKATPGHSSFLKQEAGSTNKELLQDYDVEVCTLKSVIDTYAKAKDISFIKIDVEGYEFEVIAGNDWSRNRPKVLCIESNHTKKDWRQIITDNNYRLFIKDGLNEYYIASEHWSITNGYPERIVENTYHSLNQHHAQSWQSDSEQLVKLTKLNEDKEKRISTLEAEAFDLQEFKKMSLKNLSYAQRIRRSVTGLTTDWLKHKRIK